MGPLADHDSSYKWSLSWLHGPFGIGAVVSERLEQMVKRGSTYSIKPLEEFPEQRQEVLGKLVPILLRGIRASKEAFEQLEELARELPGAPWHAQALTALRPLLDATGAIDALKAFGGADEVPAMLLEVDWREGYLRGVPDHGHGAFDLIEALGRIGDPRALPTLRRLVRERKEEYSARQALLALVRLRDTSVVPELRERLARGDVDVLRALVALGDREMDASVRTRIEQVAKPPEGWKAGDRPWLTIDDMVFLIEGLYYLVTQGAAAPGNQGLRGLVRSP